MPDRIVDELKARQDAEGLIALDTRPRFTPGDKVRILDGAFSSCIGLFESASDNERVAILLDLLGRKVRVVIRADEVAAA